MDVQITTGALTPAYTGCPALRLGSFNTETFCFDTVPSETVGFDPEMTGEVVIVHTTVRHDSTSLTTWTVIDGLMEVAERWARWHGGEWVAGPVGVEGDVDEARRGTWQSWRETVAVPMRRKDGTGLETVGRLAA